MKALLLLSLIFLTNQKLSGVDECLAVKDPQKTEDCTSIVQDRKGSCCFVEYKSTNKLSSSLAECAYIDGGYIGDIVQYIRDLTAKGYDVKSIDCGDGEIKIKDDKKYCTEYESKRRGEIDPALCSNALTAGEDTYCCMAEVDDDSYYYRFCTEGKKKSEMADYARKKSGYSDIDIDCNTCADRMDFDYSSECIQAKPYTVPNNEEKQCCAYQIEDRNKEINSKNSKENSKENDDWDGQCLITKKYKYAVEYLENLRKHYSSNLKQFDCDGLNARMVNLDDKQCDDFVGADLNKTVCYHKHSFFTKNQCCYLHINDTMSDNGGEEQDRCIEVENLEEGNLMAVEYYKAKTYVVQCNSNIVKMTFVALIGIILLW